MTTRTQEKNSAAKVLTVLDVLLRNFAHGFTPTELSRETGYSLSDLTRYVATLERTGFAERIQETGRIRASHRHARYAVQIMNSLAAAERQIEETKNRLYGGHEAETKASLQRITGK
jgi:DNA-binding IclR family transcriptional regulator